MLLSEQVVEWTRNYLNSFGGNTKAVIGISGGKDSTIAAKICVEAVGKDRVICVRLPQGHQHDLDTAKAVCDYLDAKSYELNINEICSDISVCLASNTDLNPLGSSVYKSNTPARVRMTLLYGVAACLGDCRVVNTCNFSEDYIGYSTKFGDSAGDFSPLGKLTVREVKQIGYELGIPKQFIEKPPEDGLSGMTDEENLGFSYEQLDHFILEDEELNVDIEKNILIRHFANLHKILPMPKFEKKNAINEECI